MFDVGDKVMLISPDGKAQKAKIESVSGPRHDPNYRIRTGRLSTYILPGWRIQSEDDYEYFSKQLADHGWRIQSEEDADQLPEVRKFIDYIARRMRLLSVGLSSDSGEALIFLSFDGESYEKQIEIAPGTSMELPVDVRAIRLRARDEKKPVKYDIQWI